MFSTYFYEATICKKADSNFIIFPPARRSRNYKKGSKLVEIIFSSWTCTLLRPIRSNGINIPARARRNKNTSVFCLSAFAHTACKFFLVRLASVFSFALDANPTCNSGARLNFCVCARRPFYLGPFIATKTRRTQRNSRRVLCRTLPLRTAN